MRSSPALDGLHQIPWKQRLALWWAPNFNYFKTKFHKNTNLPKNWLPTAQTAHDFETSFFKQKICAPLTPWRGLGRTSRFHIRREACPWDFDLPPQLFRLAPTRRALGRLALACLLPLPALAQHVALQDRFVPPPGWRPPTVTAPQLGGGQPIQLREARVEVEVFGGQARTRIELRLFNPNPRVLEGELQFPLLDGQVVTGFALDVNGRLRDAVPVPKARGQEIFEDIRRRRVDPGLLEATAGNQYKLRVYPIGAQAERQVALTLVETLPRQGGASLVRVPLAFASSVGRLEVRVRADGLARSQTRLVQAPQGTEVTAGNQGAELHFSRAAWTAPEGPAGWLQWALQRVDQPQAMVGETGGQRFFAAQQPFADEAVRRPAPRHVALVWDASGSAASQARVLPVLDAYFRALNKPVKVSLIVLRNRAEAVRTFDVAPGGFGALAEALRAEPQDGSSNFDELPIPPDADATVLVTDGLATDGKRQIGYRHTAPVFALNGSPVADVPRLRRLAERTGGALVDATAGSAEEAARAMLFGGWRIEKLSSLSADQLVAPTLQLQQGRLAVAGRLQDTSARVDVVLAHPSGKRRTLALDIRRPPTAGGWPGQQWAAWRSAELADEPALHQTALERIAVEHGIVGPNSALIVLEQAADYARYELPAPADLAAEVAQLRGHLQAQAAQARTQHIEAMVRQFEARQRWWETRLSEGRAQGGRDLRAGVRRDRRDDGRGRHRQPGAAPGPRRSGPGGGAVDLRPGFRTGAGRGSSTPRPCARQRTHGQIRRRRQRGGTGEEHGQHRRHLQHHRPASLDTRHALPAPAAGGPRRRPVPHLPGRAPRLPRQQRLLPGRGRPVLRARPGGAGPAHPVQPGRDEPAEPPAAAPLRLPPDAGAAARAGGAGVRARGRAGAQRTAVLARPGPGLRRQRPAAAGGGRAVGGGGTPLERPLRRRQHDRAGRAQRHRRAGAERRPGAGPAPGGHAAAPQTCRWRCAWCWPGTATTPTSTSGWTTPTPSAPCTAAASPPRAAP